MRQRTVAYFPTVVRDQLEVVAMTNGTTQSAALAELVRERYRAAFGAMNPAEALALAGRLSASERYVRRADGQKIRRTRHVTRRNPDREEC